MVPSTRRRRGSSRGMLLLESLLALLVIGIAVTALSGALILIVKSNTGSEASVVSAHLSQRMLEEVRLRRFDEKTPMPIGYVRTPSPIGIDGGESSADKRSFDDVDDFDGWSESPPRDPVMSSLEGFEGYATSVTVRYVDVDTLAESIQKTDFKAVAACSWRPNRKSVCLHTIVANR